MDLVRIMHMMECHHTGECLSTMCICWFDIVYHKFSVEILLSIFVAGVVLVSMLDSIIVL